MLKIIQDLNLSLSNKEVLLDSYGDQ